MELQKAAKVNIGLAGLYESGLHDNILKCNKQLQEKDNQLQGLKERVSEQECQLGIYLVVSAGQV